MTLKTDYKTGHPHYPTKRLKVRLEKLELAKRSRLLGRRTAQSAPLYSIDKVRNTWLLSLLWLILRLTLRYSIEKQVVCAAQYRIKANASAA